MDPTRHQGMVFRTLATPIPLIGSMCHQNGGQMHWQHGTVFPIQHEISNPVSGGHIKKGSTEINGGPQ